MSARYIKKNRSKKKVNYDKYVVIVCRSNKNISVQLLEPVTKKTIVTFNSYKQTGTKTEKATKVGEMMSDYMKKNKIDSACFDRNGYLYHGRIKALVESIRSNNIKM